MGFLDTIKKHKENFVKQQQEIGRKHHALRQDRKKYNEKLKREIREVRKKEYKKEAISSARVRARIDAKKRYNPTQSSGGGMSAEARSIIYGSGSFGSPTPAKQQVIQKIKQQQKRSPVKKKKKRSTQRTKTIIKYIEKPKPVNAVEDILKRLPQ